ncbi:PSD1 and planctomycete cytochrome C domain-containing protein [Brevifollis gellanilyticus]|uniref:Cytochrome c n=1 Tax=Brevifollis gellanilyticus TaxID=748831 RepID=A0A512MFF6_9BACT|nr:PSD1 and planctomycete cytochrome C domain-containing protein [Brevifollis gellanilyticus]GEP45474.1 cytochrome c [Brevifollis gellanilyticus]
MLIRLFGPGFLFAVSSLSAGTVHFSRDVLPILSDNCLSCHGQDESHRKADLRLDTHEGALAVIKAGKPEMSDLIARIITSDPDEIMPPPKSHKAALKPEQVDILKRWISEGAVWGKHWAFEKPVKQLAQGHPVDHFVKARLAKEGLSLSPKAPAHTLKRRLSFDITGMAPVEERHGDAEKGRHGEEERKTTGDGDGQVAVVSASSLSVSPRQASAGSGSFDYEKHVDTLLASPHFGERMAMWWLDVARYADTDGFQADATRTNWPWRDYVVESFNANKPFDQFTLEQFAGDLIPNATPEQKLATCFHRNHMTNGEGGRDKEESRIDYVIDRVNTTGSAWLGLTLGCTQCHSHKFDPITHADYYSLNAFFNSIDEDGAAGSNAKPYMSYQSPHAKRAVTEAQALVDERKPVEAKAREDAQKPFEMWLEAKRQNVRSGFKAWHVLRGHVESQEGTILTTQKDGSVLASGPSLKQDDYRLVTGVKLPRVMGLKLEVMPVNGVLSPGKSGEFILTDIKVQVRRRGSSQIRDIVVADAVADFEGGKSKAREYGAVAGTLDDDPRNGWTTKTGPKDKPHTALFALKEPLMLEVDEELIFELRHRSTDGDANIARFRLSATDQAGPAVHEIGAAPLEQLAAASEVGEKLRERLFAQFLEDHAPYQVAKESLARAAAQLKEVNSAAGKLNVMVLAERKVPRDTNILVRGVWDKKGEKVTAGVPPAIAPWPEGLARDRAGLAKWITSKDNPLTARVFVNHVWQMLFGAGLVRTPDDFGLQGQRPTHPELLDWLAVDFMEHGWDVKHLIKLIVMSETYQQSSEFAVQGSPLDPENRLLGRGPRFRLPSWMLRDAALAVSGLLNPALGGPPVRPYQPDGVWEENFMGRFTYAPSEGDAQNRRTLYAFWRRSIAPTFLFDSAQRRVCEVGMTRTNTPLQALTLLNDRTILMASRELARQMLEMKDSARRLDWLYERVLARAPEADERAVLQREWQRALAHYQKAPQEAAEYLETASDQGKSLAELAAGSLVATLVLNLDEAITHE